MVRVSGIKFIASLIVFTLVTTITSLGISQLNSPTAYAAPCTEAQLAKNGYVYYADGDRIVHTNNTTTTGGGRGQASSCSLVEHTFTRVSAGRYEYRPTTACPQRIDINNTTSGDLYTPDDTGGGRGCSFNGDWGNPNVIRIRAATSADIAEQEECRQNPRGTGCAAGSADSAEDEEDEDGAESTTTCAVEGVGWAVCPIMEFMGTLNDGAFGFLENFLAVDADLYSQTIAGSGTNPTYAAWQTFRDVANVVFVFAMLMVIYSQVTGAGITNYGIKRMLPRLIIAVILVNLSYWICAIAIDISNIVGSAVYNLLGTTLSAGTDPSTQGATWTNVIGQALTIAAGAVGLVLLVILLFSAPTALLAVAAILLILIARQAFIVLLIVLSPLAFVAYMLPNTENLWKKWRSAFTTVLLVYPIIGLIFGASTLASKIIQGVGAREPDAVDGTMFQVMALAIMAIPLFAVPVALKGAMSAAGGIGTKMSNFADKTQTLKNTRLGAMRDQFQRNRQVARAQRWGGRGSKYNPMTHVNRGLNRVSGSYGQRIAASGAEVEAKIGSEDVDRRMTLMEKNPTWTAGNRLDKASEELSSAIKSNDVVRARAAQRILLGSGSAGLRKLNETVKSTVNDSNIGSAAVEYMKSDINSAGIKGKNAALDAWSHDAGNKSLASIESNSGTYSGLTDQELAGQNLQHIQGAGISQARANDMMANQNVWAALDENKKQYVRSVAEGSTPPSGSSGGSGPTPGPNPTPTPPPPPPSQERKLSSDTVRTMGPENAGRFVEKQGGYTAMSDSDLITIRNAHGTHGTGQAARDELVRRGIINDTPPRNLP